MDWDSYYNSTSKSNDKIVLIVEWRTNIAIYSGRVKDWDALNYVIELTDGSEVTVPKKCCTVVRIVCS